MSYGPRLPQGAARKFVAVPVEDVLGAVAIRRPAVDGWPKFRWAWIPEAIRLCAAQPGGWLGAGAIAAAINALCWCIPLFLTHRLNIGLLHNYPLVLLAVYSRVPQRFSFAVAVATTITQAAVTTGFQTIALKQLRGDRVSSADFIRALPKLAPVLMLGLIASGFLYLAGAIPGIPFVATLLFGGLWFLSSFLAIVLLWPAWTHVVDGEPLGSAIALSVRAMKQIFGAALIAQIAIGVVTIVPQLLSVGLSDVITEPIEMLIAALICRDLIGIRGSVPVDDNEPPPIPGT